MTEGPVNRCLFCGEDVREANHWWRCDGRQGAVEAAAVEAPAPPPPPRRGGRTRTTAEAMTLLQQTRQRLIEQGRAIAREQIAETGSTHSRRVRAAMQTRDRLDGSVADYWLGAVFNSDEFEWTGTWHTHHSRERNIHERMVKVWTLRGRVA